MSASDPSKSPRRRHRRRRGHGQGSITDSASLSTEMTQIVTSPQEYDAAEIQDGKLHVLADIPLLNHILPRLSIIFWRSISIEHGAREWYVRQTPLPRCTADAVGIQKQTTWICRLRLIAATASHAPRRSRRPHPSQSIPRSLPVRVRLRRPCTARDTTRTPRCARSM